MSVLVQLTEAGSLFRARRLFVPDHLPLNKLKSDQQLNTAPMGGMGASSTPHSFLYRAQQKTIRLVDNSSVDTYSAVAGSSSGSCLAILLLPISFSFLFFRTCLNTSSSHIQAASHPYQFAVTGDHTLLLQHSSYFRLPHYGTPYFLYSNRFAISPSSKSESTSRLLGECSSFFPHF